MIDRLRRDFSDFAKQVQESYNSGGIKKVYKMEDERFRRTHWTVKVSGILMTAALAACGTGAKVTPTVENPNNPSNPNSTEVVPGTVDSPIHSSEIPLDHSNPVQKVVEDLSGGPASSGHDFTASALDSGSYALDPKMSTVPNINFSLWGTQKGTVACFKEDQAVQNELDKNNVSYSKLPTGKLIVCGQVKSRIDISTKDGVVLTVASIDSNGEELPFAYNNYGAVDTSKSQAEQDKEAEQKVKSGQAEGIQLADILQFQDPPASIGWTKKDQQQGVNASVDLITGILSQDASIAHAEQPTVTPLGATATPTQVSATETSVPTATEAPVQKTIHFNDAAGNPITFIEEGQKTEEMPEFATVQDALNFIQGDTLWLSGGNSLSVRGQANMSFARITPESAPVMAALQKIPGWQYLFAAPAELPIHGDQFFTLGVFGIDGGKSVIIYENNGKLSNAVCVDVDPTDISNDMLQVTVSAPATK